MPVLRPPDKPPHNSGVPTLAELIADRKHDRGLSYGELAALTDDVISRQRFQQLGTSTRLKEFPEPSTLAAIAKALNVDAALVVLATARSIGLDVQTGTESDLAMLLPASARRLTIDQRNALLAVVNSIVSAGPAGAINHSQIWPDPDPGWLPDPRKPPGVRDDEDRRESN